MSFTSPVWEYTLPVDQRIIDFTYSHTEPGKNWSSNSIDGKRRHLKLLEHECFQEFAKNIETIVRKKLFLLQPVKEYELSLTAMWLNLNGGEGNSIRLAHIHYPHIAGTYYLLSPKDCGDLVVHNPHQDTSIGPWCSTFKSITNIKHYTPEPGKGVIFPSWTQHQVLSGTSNMDRLSMSFGFRIEE